MNSFGQLLIQAAKEEGFPIVGLVDLAPSAVELSKNIEHYDQWIKAGFHGEMEYLSRGRARRADPRQLLPEAQSILCVALPYSGKAAGALEPKSGPRYARYLPGRDYHLEIAEKLETIAKRVSVVRYKVCVDTSAVLERFWAMMSGIGWIGRNSMLIHPSYGSYLFLGELILDRETGALPSPIEPKCGNCQSCMRSCPTGALCNEKTINSNRCISYLTLEKRGALSEDPALRSGTGTWVAGCDLCLEACPFNRKAIEKAHHASSEMLADWITLLQETEEHYRARVRESSLSRVKPAQFSRNLAQALANTIHSLSGAERTEFCNKLRPWIENRCEIEKDPVTNTAWLSCREVMS